jgi:hypothetical protein
MDERELVRLLYRADWTRPALSGTAARGFLDSLLGGDRYRVMSASAAATAAFSSRMKSRTRSGV